MKRILSFLLVVTALLALSACKDTPDEALIVKKDTERMVEQAADDEVGTKLSALKLPEGNYVYSASEEDGGLSIQIDAPVRVPEAGKIITAEVSEAGFTQEQVTGFFNYLFPDEQPVSGFNEPGVATKDDIQQLIVDYKMYIAEGTVEENTMYTPEELEEEIKKLETEYAAAPEVAPELDTRISDGTMEKDMRPVGYAGEGAEEEVWFLEVAGEEGMLTVTVPIDENGSVENYLGYSVGDEMGFMPHYSDANAIKIDEKSSATITKDKMEMNYEEAVKLCDDFIAAGGIENVVLSDAYMIDDGVLESSIMETEYQAAEHYAYQFYYVYTVDDCHVANLPYVGGGDEHSLPWQYATIMFRVDDNGIEYINWMSNPAVGEIINEDTGVIDFEEASEIFNTMIVASYGSSERENMNIEKTEIEIDEIELSLVRVRKQNTPGREGVYTPSWVFYGHVCEEINDDYYGGYIAYDGGDMYPKPKYPVMAINAIDGSIIDLEKGY